MVGDADGGLRCPTCGKNWPIDHATCPDDGALLATFGSDTSIDVGSSRESENGTTQFDPFSSDIRTFFAHRPYPDEPASRSPGSKSSDPPTSFVRRSTAHIELPPGSMVDEYEIDHRLGAGAMGEVYAARHVKLGKRVAVKVISPRLSEDTDAVERFTQEARTLAQMRHPGLVDVLGFGDLADGRAYFVMEYLSGESLFDRLQRGRLDRGEAIDVFGQIARALEAAHTHGVVHRDLKPENIFLARATNEPRPIVKILDFGLARLLVEVDRRAERTQSGVVIGTAMYLSPEQARGPDVDGRTDVYALGCVGYELLLGRHPFEDAKTVAALIAAHMHEVPPLPRSIDPSIPPELDLLLFAMLAKDPRQRPTLPQIRSVIEGVRSPAAARAETAPPVPRSMSRRTVAIAASALLAGIVVGAVLLGSRSGGTRSTIIAAPSAVDAATLLSPAPADARDEGVVAPAAVIDAGVMAPAARDAGGRPRGASAPGQPRSVVVGAPADASTPLDDAPVDAAAVPEPADAAESAAPTPARPIPPARGFLKIVPPPGATILVDGDAPVGALSRIPLAPGKHRVQFSAGPNKDSFTVTIEAGRIVTLDKRGLYQPAPATDDRNRTVNPFARKQVPR